MDEIRNLPRKQITDITVIAACQVHEPGVFLLKAYLPNTDGNRNLANRTAALMRLCQCKLLLQVSLLVEKRSFVTPKRPRPFSRR